MLGISQNEPALCRSELPVLLGVTTLPTAFSAKNSEISNGRAGLTSSAVPLILYCDALHSKSSCVPKSCPCQRARLLLFLLWKFFSAQPSCAEEYAILNASVYQPCRFESNLCSEAVRWIGEPTYGDGSQESVLLTRTTICEDTEQYQLNTKLVDLSDFLLEQRLPRILTYHSEKSSRRRSSMMRRCKMWSSTCASSFPIRRVLLCVCPVWASDRARVWATCFLDDWSRRAV